jgi:hypothetical protein
MFKKVAGQLIVIPALHKWKKDNPDNKGTDNGWK